MSLIFVSDHFAWSEAECHDGTPVPDDLKPNARRLAEQVLEPIRAKYGHSLIPISWYRTIDYNKRIGGAENSFHTLALAADIRTSVITDLPNLRSIIESMLINGDLPFLGGLGIYRGWIHVDARTKPLSGHVARWFGSGVGSEHT